MPGTTFISIAKRPWGQFAHCCWELSRLPAKPAGENAVPQREEGAGDVISGPKWPASSGATDRVLCKQSETTPESTNSGRQTCGKYASLLKLEKGKMLWDTLNKSYRLFVMHNISRFVIKLLLNYFYNKISTKDFVQCTQPDAKHCSVRTSGRYIGQGNVIRSCEKSRSPSKHGKMWRAQICALT